MAKDKENELRESIIYVWRGPNRSNGKNGLGPEIREIIGLLSLKKG